MSRDGLVDWLRLPEWAANRLVNLPENFTGRIEFNLFRGGLANINITESVKPEK